MKSNRLDVSSVSPLVVVFSFLSGFAQLSEGRGIRVAQVMSGTFMTSLEMTGVSLTLMRTDEERLRLFGELHHRPAAALQEIQLTVKKK